MTQAAGFDYAHPRRRRRVDAGHCSTPTRECFRRRRAGTCRKTQTHDRPQFGWSAPPTSAGTVQMGIIANCTPLWGTRLQRAVPRHLHQSARRGPGRGRLFPYGDLVRLGGAVVTYGSDIPGVDIDEGRRLIRSGRWSPQAPGLSRTTCRWCPVSPGLRRPARLHRQRPTSCAWTPHRQPDHGCRRPHRLGRTCSASTRARPHAVPVVLTMMDGGLRTTPADRRAGRSDPGLDASGREPERPGD